MQKTKSISCAVLAIISNVSFAGTMGEVKSCSDLSCMPWFLEFGTGASWSKTAKISPDILSGWNSSPDGYNSTLGTVPLYTAGIGYTISPLASVDASYTFRGIYDYNKHQRIYNSALPNPIAPRTRYFDLNSNALMVNGTLYGQGWSDKLAYEMDNAGLIQPVIGGGVGVSYNTISNFHSVLDGINGVPSAIMQDLTKASFAWQLNAGLELKKDRFSFDIGYRYFNAGTFISNNAIITPITASGIPIMTIAVPAWSSNLSANELYFTVKVAF